MRGNLLKAECDHGVWRWVAPTLLLAAVVACYGNSFEGALAFDDLTSIARNPSLDHWWSAFHPPGGGMTVSGRPVLNLSLAVNHAIGGNAVAGYHVVNLLIHWLAGIVLFGLVRRTSCRSAAGNCPGGLAFTIALLWLVHPLQTESVTYLVQRAESLVGLFYLLTMYCFLRYTEGGGFGWGALAFTACALGMGTKEVMVSAPLAVLLYDRTFVSRSWTEAWRGHRRIYLGLALTWLPLGWLVLASHQRGGTAGFGVGVDWWRYALTQFPAVGRYLWLALWPHPLIFDYGAEWLSSPAQAIPSAVLILLLVAITVVAWWRWPTLGFLGVVFFAVLAPTSLVPGVRQTIAEHRMYLSLAAGLSAAVGWVYGLLGQRCLPVWWALAIGWGLLTFQRNEVYQTPHSLWSDTVAKRPANPYAHYNLGEDLLHARNPSGAAAEFEIAIKLQPEFAEAYNNLGNAELQLNRWPDALAAFATAVRLKPGNAEAHNNLANLLAAQRRMKEATEQYEEALRLDPNFAEARNGLGTAFVRQGRVREGESQLRLALKIEPDYADAHLNLASLLAQDRRFADARDHYQAAIRLQPGNATAHFNLGNVHLLTGDTGGAIHEYEEAIRLQPDFASARTLLDRLRTQSLPGGR